MSVSSVVEQLVAEQGRIGVNVRQPSARGRSEHEIRARIETLGLVPPDELVERFAVTDGRGPWPYLFPYGIPVSLDDAALWYRQEQVDVPELPNTWHPSWLCFLGQPNWLHAVECRGGETGRVLADVDDAFAESMATRCRVVAPTLERFLAGMLEDLRAERFTLVRGAAPEKTDEWRASRDPFAHPEVFPLAGVSRA